MKLPINTIVSLLLLTGVNSFAQPVLTQNHLPDYGVHADIYLGESPVNPGGTGPNAEWDFSFGVTFNLLGYLEYMDIDQTEFEVDFPTCNLVARTRIGGDTTYNYYTDLGSEVIINGENMGAPVFYKYPTSNTKQVFDFPMNYGDSFTDTWTSNNGSGSVERFYDGYGTLKTVFYIFNNVVRIKTRNITSFGTSVSYDWYTTDAYIPVAHIDSASQQMTILKMFPVSVANTEATNNSVSFAPNPFSDKTTLHISNLSAGTKLTITNALGQVVRMEDVHNSNTTISRDGLNSGIYFYTIQSKEGIAAKGKLVIE